MGVEALGFKGGFRVYGFRVVFRLPRKPLNPNPLNLKPLNLNFNTEHPA